MSDRGAKALAERLYYGDPEPSRGPRTVPTLTRAAAILGTTGLFIADVTKHEPNNDGDCALRCRCGWEASDFPGESYFDHIGVSDE